MRRKNVIYNEFWAKQVDANDQCTLGANNEYLGFVFAISHSFLVFGHGHILL